jgi:hypothetical protein
MSHYDIQIQQIKNQQDALVNQMRMSLCAIGPVDDPSIRLLKKAEAQALLEHYRLANIQLQNVFVEWIQAC